ncbi:MAG: hypothetical protein ABL889_08050 [Terricaulis sp.]
MAQQFVCGRQSLVFGGDGDGQRDQTIQIISKGSALVRQPKYPAAAI